MITIQTVLFLVAIAMIVKAATLAIQTARENWPEDMAITGVSAALVAICIVATGAIVKPLIALFS